MSRLPTKRKKHSGELPIVGVNTFRNPAGQDAEVSITLQRSSDDEKQDQIRRLRDFHAGNRDDAPAMLQRLRDAATRGDNIFAVLMDAVRVCSLGQITEALFEVGGRYRRNM